MRPVNDNSTVSPSPMAVAMRAANTVASPSTSSGNVNRMSAASGIQAVHRQLERPGHQIRVQPDAQPADDRNQPVVGPGELAQRPLDAQPD